MPTRSLFGQAAGQSLGTLAANAPSFESQTSVATTQVDISPLGAAAKHLVPRAGAGSTRQDGDNLFMPESHAAPDSPSLGTASLPSGTTPATTVVVPTTTFEVAGPALISVAGPLQAAGQADVASGGDSELAQPTDVPVRQLATPILSVAAGTTTGSARTVTLTLRPAELGRVELRVARAEDGTLAIRLSAETPETLALLRNDQAALDRALTQAGLTTEQRHLSFDLSAGGNSQQQAGGGGQSAEHQRRPASEPETEIGTPKTAQNLARTRSAAPTSQLDISI